MPVDGLEFPRRFTLVLPAAGEPTDDARLVIERLRASIADLGPVA